MVRRTTDPVDNLHKLQDSLIAFFMEQLQGEPNAKMVCEIRQFLKDNDVRANTRSSGASTPDLVNLEHLEDELDEWERTGCRA